jgi:predicted TIM-barrel fold metal-dependent hydrolase
MLIIDSHAHAYSPEEWRYPPAEEARRPAPGVGSLAHLKETCQANGVSAAVVIQTHSFYRWDNRYISHLAATEWDWIAGVCALDPEDPRGPAILTELVRDYSIRGVRILTLNSGHLNVPEVRRLWAKATDLGLVINVVTSTAHTDQLASLLRAFPTATAVLEHSLCINREEDTAVSVKALSSLAAISNAVVELSDLPVVSRGGFPFKDAHDLYMRIIEMFGPDRCVWGSGFPTEFWIEKASYSEILDVFVHELPLDDAARSQVLGETAARLWFPDLRAAKPRESPRAR